MSFQTQLVCPFNISQCIHASNAFNCMFKLHVTCLYSIADARKWQDCEVRAAVFGNYFCVPCYCSWKSPSLILAYNVFFATLLNAITITGSPIKVIIVDIVNVFIYFQATSSIQVVSPTECFLRYSTLPEDDLELVDVQQVAVTILSYLDRFSSFYDLGPTNKKVML